MGESAECCLPCVCPLSIDMSAARKQPGQTIDCRCSSYRLIACCHLINSSFIHQKMRIFPELCRYWQESLSAAGQIIERSGIPPVLVGDGLGEAELKGLSQVVKSGLAGTDATLQETKLHKQIATQSLAKSLFAAPCMFSRNIGTLAKDITMTPRMINMALCPGILQHGNSSRRIYKEQCGCQSQVSTGKFP